MDRYHEEKIQDGWILYYSEEGYPYYYKESTEESEWAPLDRNFYHYYPQETIKGEENYDESSDSGESGTEDDSEEDSNDENDSDSDTEPSTITEKIMIDKVLEAKFLNYLKTPEGIAAAEAELERVGRKVDKRKAKRSKEAEIEYVRGLSSKKKDEDGKTGSLVTSFADITTKVLESTNAWMFPPHLKQKKKSKSVSDLGNATQRKNSEQTSKYDDYNRETKHRYRASAGGTTEDTVLLESGGRQGRSVSPNSSRSSSISSDTASFSSDDSDVAEIDAPLFSDLPVWLNMRSLASQLFDTPTVVSTNSEDNVVDTTSTSQTQTATALIPYVPANLLNLAFIQSTTTAFAQQGFQYIGGAFVQGFGMLFERLNPLLEDFVSGVIDTQLSPTTAGGNSTDLNDIERTRTYDKNHSKYKNKTPSGEKVYSSSSRKYPLSARASRSANSTPRTTDLFSPRSPPPSLPSSVLRSLPAPTGTETNTSLRTTATELYEQLRKDESTAIETFREEGDRSTPAGLGILENELPEPSWAAVVAGRVGDNTGMNECADNTDSVISNQNLEGSEQQQEQLRASGEIDDQNAMEGSELQQQEKLLGERASGEIDDQNAIEGSEQQQQQEQLLGERANGEIDDQNVMYVMDDALEPAYCSSDDVPY